MRNSTKIFVGFALFFLLIFFIFEKKWLLFISTFFLIMTLFEGGFLFIIGRIIVKMVQSIGSVSLTFFLIIVFFLLVVPLSFVFRIFNKETLNYFHNKNRKSFFKDVNIQYRKKDFEKMW